ncbi:MAG: hypothetical protein SFW36_15440 [Leptolyngbyaceae cyanobacterium bins.59]|nr:hypothetical protein [Leptolyngbyaceae cyanobacterium bins.59]
MAVIFEVLKLSLQAIQPYLVPLCFVAAWALIILVVWTTIASLRDSLSSAKKMHQVPCANCKFFTRDYHLKCTVHPSDALSEVAINCPDYDPITHPYTAADAAKFSLSVNRRSR